MTTATKVVLIAEKYYTKLWLGNGDAPNTLTGVEYPQGFDKPSMGWFYIDAMTGTIWIYNGTQWNTTSTKWTGGFL